MKLIGPIDPTWSDMSPYVVHFAKEGHGHSAYLNALSILSSQRIEARSKFGAGRLLPPARKSVCFSEVPLHHLQRIAKERGEHGIGFRKELIVARGGGPILYAYKDSAHAHAIRSMTEDQKHDPSHPIWSLAPFVDLPGVYGYATYLFEWEREWRIVGDFAFDPAEAAFLIIPEGLHSLARSFFDDAEAENVGPNYKCKFIDPYWSEERVAAALK